ncbi:hypothetical protein Tco_1520313 [Tanacetum coccineum]
MVTKTKSKITFASDSCFGMKHWTPEAQSDSIEFSTCKTPVIMLQWQGMDGTKGRMISLLTNHFNVEPSYTNDHFYEYGV